MEFPLSSSNSQEEISQHIADIGNVDQASVELKTDSLILSNSFPTSEQTSNWSSIYSSLFMGNYQEEVLEEEEVMPITSYC